MYESNIIIANDHQHIIINPEIGASILSYLIYHQGEWQPVFRIAENANHAIEAACFPMAPYCGRIKNASFKFKDQTINLPVSEGFEPNAIHGQCWNNPWEVDEQDKTSVKLSYIHLPDAWPWGYITYLTIELEENCLWFRLSIRNLSDQPMPCGIGLHPYFMKNEDVSLSTSTDEVWLTKDDLPQKKVEATGTWSLKQNKKLSEFICDHNFVGWNGQATIKWPKENIQLNLTADEIFQNTVLFCPNDENFFCFEPVSLVADGFNLASNGDKTTGIMALEPYDMMCGTVKFDWQTYQ